MKVCDNCKKEIKYDERIRLDIRLLKNFFLTTSKTDKDFEFCSIKCLKETVKELE